MRRADAAMQVFASAFQDGPKGKKSYDGQEPYQSDLFQDGLDRKFEFS